jgi:cobalt/nickel transport system permease protein
MHSIDAWAYDSGLSELDPRAKILFGTSAMLITLAVNAVLASMLTLVIMSVITLKNSKMEFKSYLKWMAVPLGFVTLSALTWMVQTHSPQTPLVWRWDAFGRVFGISSQALAEGIRLILRALASVSGMYFIVLSTPMNDLLWTLRRWKVPAMVVSLMELMYRYIFVFWTELGTIKTAQASRLGYMTVRTSIQSSGELIANLFLRTYIKCDRVYTALESRGYRGEFYQAEKSYHKSTSMLRGTVWMAILLFAAAAVERSLLGWAQF